MGGSMVRSRRRPVGAFGLALAEIQVSTFCRKEPQRTVFISFSCSLRAPPNFWLSVIPYRIERVFATSAAGFYSMAFSRLWLGFRIDFRFFDFAGGP
jgi:uncharacterized membrane protein